MDFEISFKNLTRDELEEECLHLQQKCKQLCEASESDAQRIHELKRSLETAVAAELYLSQELEQLTVNTQREQVDTKLQTEHDELRRKHHELIAEFALLQDNYNAIAVENTNLRSELEILGAEKSKSAKNDSETCNERLAERLNVLEHENMELLQKLNQQCADKMQQTMVLAEKDKKIELMRDEVSCLEENMRYKREELEEKTRMLESAQEQLFEANSKINVLMSAPETKDRKGNSLFAEVDDQRQVMKQLLAAQKKSYQEMKKIYNESQYEIRRLKRENSAMHTELQACSTIFCNADRTYQEKLNNRIQHLINQNENLERKLKGMHEYLKELAHDKGVLWLDSMLNFCKQETEDLKKQLHSMHIKNASLEEQLRNVQQDMVRWRFEALKSRCLLINRENLLTEHKIAFKPQTDVEFKMTEAQEKAARPRIVLMEKPTNTTNITSTSISMDESTNENETTSNQEKSMSKEEVKCSSSDFKPQSNETVACFKENNTSTVCQVESSSPIVIKTEVPSRRILQEINSQELQPTQPNADVKELRVSSMELPSILCKKREILGLNAEKNVKFAVNEATVHNISASPDTVADTEQSKPNAESSAKHNNITATTVKTIRTKSNVVVRRVVVGSKPK